MNAPPLIHAAVTMRTRAHAETEFYKRSTVVCARTRRTIRAIENGRVLLASIHTGSALLLLSSASDAPAPLVGDDRAIDVTSSHASQSAPRVFSRLPFNAQLLRDRRRTTRMS